MIASLDGPATTVVEFRLLTRKLYIHFLNYNQVFGDQMGNESKKKIADSVRLLNIYLTGISKNFSCNNISFCPFLFIFSIVL